MSLKDKESLGCSIHGDQLFDGCGIKTHIFQYFVENENGMNLVVDLNSTLATYVGKLAIGLDMQFKSESVDPGNSNKSTSHLFEDLNRQVWDKNIGRHNLVGTLPSILNDQAEKKPNSTVSGSCIPNAISSSGDATNIRAFLHDKNEEIVPQVVCLQLQPPSFPDEKEIVSGRLVSNIPSSTLQQTAKDLTNSLPVKRSFHLTEQARIMEADIGGHCGAHMMPGSSQENQVSEFRPNEFSIKKKRFQRNGHCNMHTLVRNVRRKRLPRRSKRLGSK